jgi:hypothetical protein
VPLAATINKQKTESASRLAAIIDVDGPPRLRVRAVDSWLKVQNHMSSRTRVNRRGCIGRISSQVGVSFGVLPVKPPLGAQAE